MAKLNQISKVFIDVVTESYRDPNDPGWRKKSEEELNDILVARLKEKLGPK